MDTTTEARSHHYGEREDYHHIEEAVRVYLHATPDGTRWEICGTTTANRLGELSLPTAEELLRMLAESLGYDVVKHEASQQPQTYDHDPRPDDMPEPGDRCKDCGEAITWVGPSHNNWMHVNDPRNA